MNKISDRTNRTVVKIFINTLATMSLVLSPVLTQAQTPSPTPSPTPNQASMEDVALRTKQYCGTYFDKIEAANRNIAAACRKAGLGGSSNCVEKAKNCGETTEEESFDTLGALTQAAGTFMGNQNLSSATSATANKGCPQLNGRDYFTEKDKIQDQIKDMKKELADLDNDKADAKKEYDDAIKEIQEDLAKAQKKAKDDGLDVDEDLRKQVADFQTNQASAAKSMREQGTSILTLRGQLISLDRQKAQALLELSDFTARTDCKKKMIELNNAYKAVNSGTSSGHITRAKAKKAELIETFNKCMVGFTERRKNLNETFKQQRDLLEKKIADTESDVTAVEDSLSQSESQLAQIKNDANTKKQNALQEVIDLGTRSQSAMESAYNNLQTKNSALAKKEQSLNESLNQASNSLLTLGPAPARGTEYSSSEASSEIDSELQNIASIQRSAPSECTDAKTAAKEALKKYGGSK